MAWDPVKTYEEKEEAVTSNLQTAADPRNAADPLKVARAAYQNDPLVTIDEGRKDAQREGDKGPLEVRDRINEAWVDFKNGVPGALEKLKGVLGGAGGAGGAAGSLTAPTPINPAEAFSRANTANIDVSNVPYAPTKVGAQTIFAQDAAKNASTNPQLQALLTQLSNQAQGIGPSVAGTQLQQGREANLAAVMAQAQSSRGGFNPLVARTAMQTGAEMNAKANQEAALQRLQEQQASQQLLGTTATAVRAQDIQAASEDAARQTDILKTQANLDDNQARTVYNAQVNAKLASADLQKQYLAMGYSVEQANQAATLEYQRVLSAAISGDKSLNAQQQAGLMGMLSTGLGALVSAYTSNPAAGAAVSQGTQSLYGQYGTPSNSPTATVGQQAPAAATPATATQPTATPTQSYGVGKTGGAYTLAGGGEVPGKAPKDGDHPDNDIIPARLSPGEFVLPRSLTKDKELMKLVHEKMAAHEAGKKQEATASGFADLLKAQADLNKKIEALQKQMKGK
jgi:hypothetical protein